MRHRLQAARSSLGDWAFWLWAVVGLGFGFGISVIGLFTVPAVFLLTIFLLTRPRLRRSAYGLLVGIGAPLLVVAYLNRGGPRNCLPYLRRRAWNAVRRPVRPA
jgi:hypothetical protein